ncbi:uncharacterized protein LAJ45_00205 [Morchella importuna]|uniref:Uncharacterized protein n=1 Tax=Morchella conica CCBAS932 TaxID=1392247 RepID=A0A3N4KQR5_9PEZI|nr:uncharacterized protein LAJ45_00205 [Morchella importuna]KAH8155196.1 hypothetical protein LAJ45_00205 [Morchella importuna]RPB11828.1 hypothetical protein P167DRAFT_524029 [Morchella conica CCBAS932]
MFSLSRFGIGQFTKPVLLFSLILLTISTVFTTFILCGTTSPALRKFYLISFSYNDSKTTTEVLNGLEKLDGLLSSSKNDSATFSLIRVGYRGLCVDHSEGWDCARTSADLERVAGDLGGDPLDLMAIADIYRSRISFSLPVWVAVIAMAVGWLGVAVNCIPGIPIPAWTKKVAAVGCSLGTLALMGTMVLQQVTSGAVSTLVQKMGINTVEAKIGGANVGFGWAAFALSLLATIAICAIVFAEWGIATAQAKALEKGDYLVGKATGGKVGMSDFATSDPENGPQKPAGTQPSLGTSTLRSQLGEKALDYGKQAALGAFQNRMKR